MKKAVGLSAALLMIGVLAGCAPKAPDANAAENKKEPAQIQTAEPDRNKSQPVGTGSGAVQNSNSGGTTDPNQPVSSGTHVGLPISNDAYRITEVRTLASAKVIAVTGKLRAFEAVGAFAVKGSDGKVIKLPSGAEEGVIRASKGAPEWGDFTAEIPLPQNLRDKKFTLEFFVHSAKDGSRQQLLSVTILYN